MMKLSPRLDLDSTLKVISRHQPQPQPQNIGGLLPSNLKFRFQERLDSIVLVKVSTRILSFMKEWYDKIQLSTHHPPRLFFTFLSSSRVT